jgi:PAS domain S-box-containing protein
MQIIPHVDFQRVNPVYLFDDKSYLYTKLLSNYILFFITAGVSGFLSQKLLRSRNDLERTVEERTKELTASNKRLQREIEEREHAQKALRESERKFRSLVELTSDWIWETDQFGVYTYASPRVKEILGYEPEEIIGMTPYDIIAPEEAEDVVAFYVQKARRRESFTGYVNTNIRKDGTRIVVETSGTPVFDENGKPTGYRGVDRDITERQRAEQALRDSERRLKILFEYAPDAYYLNDFEGKFVDGNRAAEKLIGYPRIDLIGKSFLELNLLSPQQLEIAAKNLAENAQGIATGPVELILNRKDGGQVTVEVTTFPVTIEDQFLALGIARDVTERKQAERMLRFTQFSIDKAADAAFWMGPDGQLIYINDAACDVLGYSREELLSMTVHDIDPDFPAAIWPNHWQELKEHGSFTFESHHRTKDGRIFPVEITANFMEFEGEEYNCAFVHDISERKETEKTLEESLALLRATLESTADGMLVVDTEGHVQTLNRKFIEMWDLPESATCEDFEMRIHISQQLRNPDEVFKKTQYLYEHPDEESVAVIELNDGRIFEWYAKPLRIGGTTVGIVENFRDVSERRRAEQLLQESEEKYRALFEESKDSVFISTPEGRFLDINQAGAEMFGYSSKEELLEVDIARDLYEVPNQRERIKKELEEKGYVKDYEILYRKKNGSVITVLETVTAVRDSRGKIVAFRGIQRDVTDQRKLEQQFIQAQKMESLGTLAGGIAHDFNNILSGVLGYASFLKSKIGEDHPHYRYINTIERSSKRAAELTAQLLGFARGGKYNVKPLNLNSVAKEVLNIIESTFSKKIEIETHFNNLIPTVSADVSQLQQVIMNLCVNASDAMSDGGTLTIETDIKTLTEDYVKAHPWAEEGIYVCLSIGDTGVGMDEETRKRIYEPFFTTKEEGKGTGLGLSMVYGVVKNHGGYIDVISQPSQGSTFEIYLPICGEREDAEIISDTAPDGRRELILIVDDEESVRQLAHDVLEAHGYRVLAAADGLEALEMYGRFNGEIRLVILDMTMPRMGGHETFLRMKENNPDIRAMLATGFGPDDKTKEVLRSGFIGLIQKPFLPNTLLSMVRSTLDNDE